MSLPLNELLVWAIQNSDPEELHRRAENSDQAEPPQGTTTETTGQALTLEAPDSGAGASSSSTVSENDSQAPKPLKETLDPKWLDALFPDDAKKMKKLVETTTSANSSEDERIAALEELEFYVESIDNAQDLNKINGLKPVIDLLDPTNALSTAAVRVQAAAVIATCAQNNPTVQMEILGHGGLDLLLSLLRTDSDVAVQRKSLYAISSIVRSNRVAYESFCRSNGVPSITALFASPDLSLQQKSVFFLTSLLKNEPSLADSMRCMPGVLSSIFALLKSGDREVKEKTLFCIVALIENNKENVQAFKALGLANSLNEMSIGLPKAPEKSEEDEFLEIRDAIVEIRKLLK